MKFIEVCVSAYAVDAKHKLQRLQDFSSQLSLDDMQRSFFQADFVSLLDFFLILFQATESGTSY